MIPPLPPLPISPARRVALFGAFTWQSAPLPGDPEHVQADPKWAVKNITIVEIPQLKTLGFYPRVRFHALGAKQFAALFVEWESAGLLGKILAWNGAYNPRFKRQAGTFQERAAKCKTLGLADLSNHAWGTAFDINANYNPLGAVPAQIGQPGCTRELVAIARKHGFFWGGDFRSRPDGMHFEITQLQI